MAVVRARNSPPYSLISVMAVCVISVALAVLFYLKWSKAEDDLRVASRDLGRVASMSERGQLVPNLLAGNTAAGATALGEASKQMDQLKEIITGDARASVSDLAQRKADALKNAKAEGGADYASLLQAVEGLTRARNEKATALAALEVQVKSLSDRVTSAGRDSAGQLAAAQQTIGDLRQELAKTNGELQAAMAARDDAVAKGQEALNKQIATAQEDKTNLVLENQQKQADLAKAETEIRELRVRVGMLGSTDNSTSGQPSGQVIRVSPADGLVYINLTIKDRMVPGLTFTVYDPRVGVRFGNDEAAMGNGSIEVIDPGEQTTVCKITHVTKGHTIQSGDLIGNLAYQRDRTRKQRFVVVGDFDLDGDGVATAGERDRLAGMIRNWGGQVDDSVTSQTDYLVMGTKPKSIAMTEEQAAVPGSAGEQRAKQQAQYDALEAEAKRLRIPVLNANRFLLMIGYYNTTINRY